MPPPVVPTESFQTTSESYATPCPVIERDVPPTTVTNGAERISVPRFGELASLHVRSALGSNAPQSPEASKKLAPVAAIFARRLSVVPSRPRIHEHVN